MDTVAGLPTLEALRGHVLTTLCEHDQLDPRLDAACTSR